MSKVVVSFRGSKAEFEVKPGLTVGAIKRHLIEIIPSSDSQLLPTDIKLLFKGKSIDDENEDLSQLLKPFGKKVHKILAVGRSRDEVHAIQEEHAEAKDRAPRIRDDLTPQGQRDVERRKRLGQQMLQQAAQKENRSARSIYSFGFGRIETLPNLPHENKAREILEQLANDPGILACMKKHNWHVGSLAELYPKGKVGETAVCVMGLNRNKGQQILLRIRTDDLKGFRKILSIRKVLYHELAHNVHSEHDGQFFQLMRQIEKECNSLDWTQGEGLSSIAANNDTDTFTGGVYRLGGGEGGEVGSNAKDTGVGANNILSARELRAQAALNRMTAEEHEIQEHCGCGREALFLPESLKHSTGTNNSDHGSSDSEGADMDTSS